MCSVWSVHAVSMLHTLERLYSSAMQIVGTLAVVYVQVQHQ